MTLATLHELAITTAVVSTTDLKRYHHRYDIKTISVNSAATQTFILPRAATSTATENELTFVKLGKGNVIIQTAPSDIIANSAASGYIYNSSTIQLYATLTIRAVPSANKWVIIGAHGTWQHP